VDLYGNFAITESLIESADQRIKGADLALGQVAEDQAESMARGEDYMGFKHRAETVLYSGFKLGLEAAKGVLEVADFAIDLGYVNADLYEKGGREYERTLQRVESIDAAVSNTASSLKQLYRVTKEDPKGTYEAVSAVAQEKVPELYKRAKNQLNKTYMEGDLKALGGTTGVLLGAIEPNKKAKSLKGALNLINEVVDTVSDKTRKLRRTKKVIPNATESGKFSKWDVGEHDIIRKNAESGLTSHHVGTDKAMREFISDYDRGTAPAMLVPGKGHISRIDPDVPALARKSKGFDSARNVVARDIRELRRVYPDVPNSQLRKLIEMNKQKYPEAMRRR
jgi:hypothetical protein